MRDLKALCLFICLVLIISAIYLPPTRFEPMPISALKGTGTGELLDLVCSGLTEIEVIGSWKFAFSSRNNSIALLNDVSYLHNSWPMILKDALWWLFCFQYLLYLFWLISQWWRAAIFQYQDTEYVHSDFGQLGQVTEGVWCVVNRNSIMEDEKYLL